MDFKKMVVYQIYPRSFNDGNNDGIGDLYGIIEKLDYLRHLGIDVIWLSPIYKSPDHDNGYDISDYYDISEKFGNLDIFKKLLNEAHSRNIKIVMDLVVNHTSDEHEWFKESRASKNNPKRDYYIWRKGFNGGMPTKQYGFFMEPIWTYDGATDEYYFHAFAVQQPELNWENEELRQHVYKMMRFWLDMGVDGFRMDVINLISKPKEAVTSDGGEGANISNGPKVHEYLQEMNREVLSKYDTITVGETPGVSPADACRYANLDGSELNMVFHFELVGSQDIYGVSKWHTEKVTLANFKKITEKWQKELYGKAWNSLYLSNHDQPRQVSRYGNTSNKLYWEKSAKMLATIMHMQQGTPYIYQGEEIGMTNYHINSLDDCRDYEIFTSYKDLVEDKKKLTHDQMIDALNERCRDHARTPVQWDTSKNAGFSDANPWIPVNPNYKDINVASQIDDPNSILNYYRKLISLRKKIECITDGKFNLILAENSDVFAYTRENADTRLTVIANYTDKELEMPLQLNGELLISNYSDTNEKLRPYETMVYMEKL